MIRTCHHCGTHDRWGIVLDREREAAVGYACLLCKHETPVPTEEIVAEAHRRAPEHMDAAS
jgi:hypothetical protein